MNATASAFCMKPTTLFTSTRSGSPGTMEHGDLACEQAHELRVPLPARATGQDGDCLPLGETGPVRPVVGQGVERIADSDDPRQQRDRRAPSPVRVAVAVESLVV